MNDRVLGIIALFVAAFLTWFGWDIQAPFSYEPVGPRAFPLLLALIIAFCGTWLAFKGGNQAEPNPPGANFRIALMMVFCGAYAYVFDMLGFIVATTLMTIAVGRLFSGAWKKIIIGGFAMSVLLFLLFDRVLDVVLPLGVLENFL